MRKRICILLLGLLFVSSQPLSVFAENTEGTEDALTTATQQKALDELKDIDYDIREELDTQIPEDKEEIIISNTKEFLEFAKNCTLDTWSVNKVVKLTDDISLIGNKFTGIPTFGGEFDGNGHTISNLSIGEDISYCALFSNLQKTGIIRNLNVKGTVMPSGEQIVVAGIVANNYGRISHCEFKGVISANDYVGGIAGINQLTGEIDYCSSGGYVHGIHFTGGIAGENMGNISNCTNEASVNTSNTDTKISVDGVNTLNKVIAFFKNLKKTSDEASADVTVTDIGGIAGESIGIILRCINVGDVGYEHVGYNIGGIAGRQSGYIYKCTNNGKIRGRKDIAGIVGQAEPYITVDLSTDVAYQLTEAIGKLHDDVTIALRDTKNQSGVITSRLSVIKQFTDGALDDVKYLAAGTVDYANGVSGAATEAFSRVDYLMEETAKENGALDYAQRSLDNFGDSSEDIENALDHLDIETYLEGDELKQYRDAKKTLKSAAAQYKELSGKAYKPFYNYYVYDNKRSLERNDFDYILSDSGEKADYTQWSSDEAAIENNIVNGTGPAAKGFWKYQDGKSFPDSEIEMDLAISAAAKVAANSASGDYAQNHYQSPVYGKSYYEDLQIAGEVIASISSTYLPIMADDVRKDALKAMGDLEDATDNLQKAGGAARSLLGNLAAKDDIVFPQFSQEYKTRTVSLVDNFKGMNNNFGLLSSELNNATGVLVDDLQSITDQFNTIMLLFTDAVDGVLEQDYTTKFEDVSLEEADSTTDATIDDCVNYGHIEGDIDVAGIAGAMAIEYDYDLESDITGIKDKLINTSYITKCVVRSCRNCNDITSEKNCAGGICGLQEMGTIVRSSNIGNTTSRSGEYVGGICGRSISYIISSKATGILTGPSYVGGVAGDGKHIRECMTLVKVENADSWYGAVAGHVSEDGVVRDNYFYSDDLCGIDRVSYSKKAEPLKYSDGDIPDEFKKLTVSYILEDEDLDSGEKLIQKTNVVYGSSLSEADYPVVEDKKGHYVIWETPEVVGIKTDTVVKAKYIKYRTTLSEEPENGTESLHQQEVLVDGQFKVDDRLLVNRNRNYTINDLGNVSSLKDFTDYETVTISIPDDGNSVHQLRFRPMDSFSELFNKVEVYLIEGNEKTLLEKTGTMGKYDTYDIEGNNVTLNIRFANAENTLKTIFGGVIGVLVLLVVIIIVVIILIKKNGRLLPKLISNVAANVNKKIESKEQLFYDDSAEDTKLIDDLKKIKEDKKKEEKKKEDSEKHGKKDGSLED